jgi:hypothetical protein
MLHQSKDETYEQTARREPSSGSSFLELHVALPKGYRFGTALALSVRTSV